MKPLHALLVAFQYFDFAPKLGHELAIVPDSGHDVFPLFGGQHHWRQKQGTTDNSLICPAGGRVIVLGVEVGMVIVGW